MTASVQGHNINVFKIVPGLLGGSSVCDAGTSYVHLYRLQRGLTNAVRAQYPFNRFCLYIFLSAVTYFLFSFPCYLLPFRLYRTLVSVMTATGL